MFELFVFLAPAAIATLIHLHFEKRNVLSKDIFTFLSFAFFINLICFAIIGFAFKNLSAAIIINQSYSFALKFMFLSLIIAVILPSLFNIIKRNISIEFVLKKDAQDKEDETKE